MRGVLALVVSGVVLAGCGSADVEPKPPDAAQVPAGRDCLAHWNVPGNAENQARLLQTGYRVGGVSFWIAEASGGDGSESDGCSYLFHDDETFISFTGHWEGDVLVWDPKQTTKGPWSPEQEAGGYNNSHLVAEDGTVQPDPDWKSPTSEESAGPLATAARGGRGESPDSRADAPARPPYQPLEEVEVSGAVDVMPTGCSPADVAGLFDHFFDAFNRGDGQALQAFLGPGFQYYVHPRNFIEQPESRQALVPFLLERHADEERMLLLAVRVDALADNKGPFEGTVEVDLALAFHTPTTSAPHWAGALVDCRSQTLVNVGYRSHGLDLVPDEIVAHAACPPAGKPPAEGHRVACARVQDIEARPSS